MTGTTIELVIESFSNFNISKVEGESDFMNIKAVKKLIITNALLCESKLGKGGGAT